MRFIYWFWEGLKRYAVAKLIADFLALLLILLIWYLKPSVLLEIFEWNAGWVGDLWNAHIEPRLSTELRMGADAVAIAHDAMISWIQLTSYLSGDEPQAAARLESLARILLIGEVWLVKIELSVGLRFVRRVWRVFKWLFTPKHAPPRPI